MFLLEKNASFKLGFPGLFQLKSPGCLRTPIKEISDMRVGYTLLIGEQFS